jgi:hypothetical protein
LFATTLPNYSLSDKDLDSLAEVGGV